MLNYKPNIIDQYYKKHNKQKGFGLFHVFFLPFMKMMAYFILCYSAIILSLIVSGHIGYNIIDTMLNWYFRKMNNYHNSRIQESINKYQKDIQELQSNSTEDNTKKIKQFEQYIADNKKKLNYDSKYMGYWPWLSLLISIFSIFFYVSIIQCIKYYFTNKMKLYLNQYFINRVMINIKPSYIDFYGGDHILLNHKNLIQYGSKLYIEIFANLIPNIIMFLYFFVYFLLVDYSKNSLFYNIYTMLFIYPSFSSNKSIFMNDNSYNILDKLKEYHNDKIALEYILELISITTTTDDVMDILKTIIKLYEALDDDIKLNNKEISIDDYKNNLLKLDIDNINLIFIVQLCINIIKLLMQHGLSENQREIIRANNKIADYIKRSIYYYNYTNNSKYEELVFMFKMYVLNAQKTNTKDNTETGMPAFNKILKDLPPRKKIEINDGDSYWKQIEKTADNIINSDTDFTDFYKKNNIFRFNDQGIQSFNLLIISIITFITLFGIGFNIFVSYVINNNKDILAEKDLKYRNHFNFFVNYFFFFFFHKSEKYIINNILQQTKNTYIHTTSSVFSSFFIWLINLLRYILYIIIIPLPIAFMIEYQIMIFFPDEIFFIIIASHIMISIITSIMSIYKSYYIVKKTCKFISEIIHTNISIEGEENKKTMVLKDKIKFNNLSYIINDTKDLFNNFSGNIELGKKYAIIGPSGCGKSTLVKFLTGINREYSGSIESNNIEFKSASQYSLVDNIAFLTQSDNIIDQQSVRHNLTLGRDFTNNQIYEVLEKVKLTSWLEELDNGLDTIVGNNASNLSGGQRKRIQLARLLLFSKAKVLVLDEPFVGIDKVATNQSLDNILNLVKEEKKTLFLITHNIELANFACDAFIFCDNSGNWHVDTYKNLAKNNKDFQMYITKKKKSKKA